MKSKKPILHTLSALALSGALLAGCNRAERGEEGGAVDQDTETQEQGTGLEEEGTGAGGAGMDTMEGMDTGMGLPGGTGTGGAGETGLDTAGTGMTDTAATGEGGGAFPGDTATLDTMGAEQGM
jgi:hypothetical protein